jgi:gamma-glutamylcyclotransferase (GGCT)/AIG2-like uncharacterized protein YtfP
LTLPIAFYGSLMARRGDTRRFFSDLGYYGEDCLIPGDLYNVGPFPALVPGTNIAEGQLWYPWLGVEDEALRVFDRIESYVEGEPESSMYLRRTVRLVLPEIEARVYYWNFSTRGMSRIASGSWREWEATVGAQRLQV